MPGRIARVLRHLFTDQLSLRRAFPAAALERIGQRIAEGEARHSAEIRLAIEDSLDIRRVWAGSEPRGRALEVFASLRVWDTEANNGVLVYVDLADHAVEIVADRAAARAIEDAHWRAVADELCAAYRRGEYLEGTLAAIDRMDSLLAAPFPPGERNPDELPNRPAILSRGH
jgi:uncharacterized membrane protein